MSVFSEIVALKVWLKQAEVAIEKAIETGDVTGLKKVINDLRDLGLFKTSQGTFKMRI